jgi:hypothetical protein
LEPVNYVGYTSGDGRTSGTNLSPRRGWFVLHFSPRLAPWAAFWRRFAAGGVGFCCAVSEMFWFSRKRAGTFPDRATPGSHIWRVANDLSPRWGWSVSHASPQLAPVAAFLRRFAASGAEFGRLYNMFSFHSVEAERQSARMTRAGLCHGRNWLKLTVLLLLSGNQYC